MCNMRLVLVAVLVAVVAGSVELTESLHSHRTARHTRSPSATRRSHPPRTNSVLWRLLGPLRVLRRAAWCQTSGATMNSASHTVRTGTCMCATSAGSIPSCLAVRPRQRSSHQRGRALARRTSAPTLPHAWAGQRSTSSLARWRQETSQSVILADLSSCSSAQAPAMTVVPRLFLHLHRRWH